MFSRQAAASGNTAAIRSSATHPLDLRRHLAPASRARHRQRDGRVPAPPRLEHRRVEERLHEHVSRRLGVQIAEDIRQRERVLRPQREHQRVLGGGRLQLEVELPAEALAQGQPPGLVDAAAERRVQHQLHAAGFVEEPLEHERLLRRDDAERAAALGEVRTRPGRRRPARGRSPPSSSRSCRRRTAGSSSRRSTSARRSLTARDSSSLRAGASPSQNGIVGGAPFASATRTLPPATCRMSHDALPSWKMSPALLSIAKSSLSVPMNVSSGSRTTR